MSVCLQFKDEIEFLSTAFDIQDNIPHFHPKLIDIRSKENYESAHIIESTNIPLNELNDRLMELPPRDEVKKIELYVVGFESEQINAINEVDALLTKTGYLVKGALIFNDNTFDSYLLLFNYI